jgi:hypothetical protein
VVYVRPGVKDEFEVWYPKGYALRSLEEVEEKYTLLLKLAFNVKEEMRIYVE